MFYKLIGGEGAGIMSGSCQNCFDRAPAEDETLFSGRCRGERTRCCECVPAKIVREDGDPVKRDDVKLKYIHTMSLRVFPPYARTARIVSALPTGVS